MPSREFKIRLYSETLVARWDWESIGNDVAFAEIVPPPSFAVPPVITGNSWIGQTLTGNSGTLSYGTVTERQWLADGVEIIGATGSTLLLTSAEIGKVITFRVRGAGAGGTVEATSAAMGPVLDAANSITHQGVTFTFSTTRPVFRYANDDPGVVGPVSITAISPASTVVSGTYANGASYTGRVVHGTMVNPGNRSFASGGLVANNASNSNQGFDSLPSPGGSFDVSTAIPYTAGFNVDPGATGSPLVVTTGSVVKAVSQLTPANLATTGRRYLAQQVVLTVVDSIPAVGAIRPGISSASKASLVAISDFDLTKLRNLAPTASAPSAAAALALVDNMFPAQWPQNNTARNITGANGQPEYGQDIGRDTGSAMLALHLSSLSAGQKAAIVAHKAALANDLVSRCEEGGVSSDNGGGHSWKKGIVAMMAALAGENAPASWLTYLGETQQFRWAEDRQIFRVSGYDIALPRFTGDGRPRAAFTYLMLGSAEWGEQAIFDPARNGSNWDAYYRDIVFSSNAGQALAVELTTGGRAAWPNEAFWDYMDTVFLRRTEVTAGNAIPTFHLEMMAAYRPAKTTAPALLDAGIKGNAIWLRFDQAFNETATLPATSAFVVNVNGSPVTISSVSIWRQNIGLALAAPVTGNDVVTVSYTVPGTNPARSVDGVNVASFTGQALTNRTDKVGGPNAAYPVVEFTSGVRRTLAGGSLGPAATQVGTLALLKFRFPALPAADIDLLGNTSGAPGFRLILTAGGQLEVRCSNAGGTTVLRQRHGPGLSINTDYDILISFDLAQANSTVGMSSYVNGTAQTVGNVTWTSGQSVDWTRAGTSGTVLNHGNFTFRIGAIYINTATRLDLTNAANRAKFTSVTSGNLDILTRGDGITGSIPAQLLVGNADQWNDGSGMNRGSSAGRFFVTSGAATLISGAEWI